MSIPSVDQSHAFLIDLILSWKTRYFFTIAFKENRRRSLLFSSEWSREATPHEPNPEIRCNILFQVEYQYQTKQLSNNQNHHNHNNPNVSVGVNVDTSNSSTPQIRATFQIDHEQFIHQCVSGTSGNIDHHILRVLKFKALLFNRSPFPLSFEKSQFYLSRHDWNYNQSHPPHPPGAGAAGLPSAAFPLSAANGYQSQSQSQPLAQGSQLSSVDDNAFSMENNLISMFQKADHDASGFLDRDELEDLLLSSRFGFSKDDISVILSSQQSTSSAGHRLAYSNFIPVAVDLVQAQKAASRAAQITNSQSQLVYAAQLARVQSSKSIHQVMDLSLSELDKDDTGKVSVKDLTSLLLNIDDLPLSENEVTAIISRLSLSENSNGKGEREVEYHSLQELYDRLILDSLVEVAMEASATETEKYLYSIMKAAAEEKKKGNKKKKNKPLEEEANNNVVTSKKSEEETLTEEEVTTILRSADPQKINLSTTQIYAIVGSSSSNGIIKIRLFSRVCAMSIEALLSGSLVNERLAVIQRASITPIELMAQSNKVFMEKQMKSKFVEFDSDRDGFLSKKEFFQLIADTGLILSNKDILELFLKADVNGDGQIDFAEFIRFSYSTLLHLARDAALKNEKVNIIVPNTVNLPSAT